MIDKAHSYLKTKADCYEVYYDDTSKLRINIKRDIPDFALGGETSGMSVKVFMDGRIGSSSTTNLSRYKECVDGAIKNAKLNEKDKKFRRFQKKLKIPNVKGYSQKLLDQTSDEVKKYLKDFMSNVKSVEPRACVGEGSYTKSVRNIRVINSEGVDIKKKTAVNWISDELIVDDISMCSFDESKLPLEPSVALEHAKRLVSLRNRKKPETKDMQLLIHPNALSNIMSQAFAYSINAENVQNKRSFLAGKLNNRVFDKKMSIVDSAIKKDLIGSEPFDDEGTPSQSTPVVKNGVLKNYLYNTYAAFSENKKSTGNCARNLNMPPTICTTNVIFEKGKSSFERMMPEVSEGIYVKSLLGAHTMNEMTGEFSVGASEAHIIRKGEVLHAVKDTMIAGNFFDIMKEVVLIENKLYHGGSGYYLPHILFPKIKVIG